ncbi:snoRNA-splicing protein PRP40 CYBJADRAFT_121285, partial [Cyberlindnera jadinii NRRL Y-1542]
VWRPVQHESGKTYYFNDETQQSVWEKPVELQTPLERALAESDWREYKAENGREYYYNVKSQESVWEIPEEIQRVLDEQQDGAEGAGDKQGEEASDGKASEKEEKYHNDSTLLKETVKPSTQEEADKMFVELLRENAVDATWSFSKIVDELILDPRYWAVDDSLHKKQVFENYLANRTKEELMKENNSVEKFKDAFVKLLESKKEIKYYTRWSTTRKLLQDEPIYAHSVISERVKKQTFQDYVESLRKQRLDERTKLKGQALGELNDYFKSLRLNASSTWESTLDTIKQDPRFEQNTHFEVLTQLDLITLFESNLVEIEQQQMKLVQVEARKNYRADRKARDGFKELLGELKESELFNANSKWDEIYELIKEDDRFLDMLGRNGSTPFELFQDAIDEEELLIKAKQGVAEQILFHNGFKVQTEGDLDQQLKEMVTILQKDELTKDYDNDTIELIHSRLVADAKEQAERDKFAKERQIRRGQEDFKKLLRIFANPVITVDTKWEFIQPRLEKEPEYEALPDEESRRSTFDKF